MPLHECETDVARHLPGFVFTLHSHPRDDVNQDWWNVEVRHEGKQPQVLEEEAPDERGLEYRATLIAIPHDTRFVPENTHKKMKSVAQRSLFQKIFPKSKFFC
ncbi:MAG: hypothetical protein ACRC4G_02120 [Alphaproteobacteria bacterium]